jgi:NodT family efflux transporter outer membrane factor (OMF) lipoprotein
VVHQSATDFILPVDFSYELDVWGRVRLTVAAARAQAQASAADLETVRLSLHADLALDYFELRGLDAERALLDNTVVAFQRALDLTRNRFTGGIASQADVDLAETQLQTTRAEAVEVGVQRAALEHAIAELTGKAPATFTLASIPLSEPPPDIPAGIPSDLLERRPDIAAAERRIAAAAANVGVANAAFFPRLLLTATAGLESRSLGSWLTGLSGFWTAGPALAYTIFDAGRRHATSEQATGAFDETVADYQETILRSLQDVEDSLSTLRILRDEADVQASAVAAAERSVTQANNRYRGGVATYLEVIAAQSAALNNERTALSLLTRRLSASVLLIKALGGGWNVSTLPVIKTGSR